MPTSIQPADEPRHTTMTGTDQHSDNRALSLAASKGTLSRRQFLSKAALSIGAAAVASRAAATPLASTTRQEIAAANASALATDAPLASCAAATIATRLFASSNKGENEGRNQLSIERLRCAGFDIQNPTVTQRQFLRFAGTDSQRASDLQNIATGAVAAPKLLLGVRGGYGAMRLLPMVDWPALGRVMKEQGTIMAGFSDVTAVQCALLAQGTMSSLAAPMLYSEFGKSQPDPISCQGFVEALTNPALTLTMSDTALHLRSPSETRVTGTLWGGNLSVVSALAGSAYLPKPEGGIVFLEDVGEQTYRIERMLYSLYLAGAFKGQQAIVLGAFSNIGTDSYDDRYDMTEVIMQLRQVTGLPVLTGVPFGHVARKHSFPLGSTCTLTTEDDGFTLTFSDYPVIDRSLIKAEALWR
ncbi:LD-carboxypeptidase [Psychrobacter pygoscelis]|uniref:LD-carboxypeptidase n=1 Tax=Psychrobacter pygoscelis TaxID=2488563 RepID=UPI001F6028F7|nr:LD-carboxypeptidase [Psychrobacter pygoscelis]